MRRNPPIGMMGIAESILSTVEGLHPSYAESWRSEAGNQTQSD